MPTPTGASEFSLLLQSLGIDTAALGIAYLLALATVLLTTACFAAMRHYVVVSPNHWTRDYGTYVSLVLATLLIATGLENQLLPSGSATLYYAAVPQLLILLWVHLAIWRRPEPWLVALGAAATTATVVVAALAGLLTDFLRPAYWVALLMLAALLVFLWRQAVSTKRGFVKANSIYLRSKETLDAVTAEQKPWLGLPQWVALIGASVALAIGNSLLRGLRLEQIPATEVAAESGLLLLVTAVVCSIPAASYWLARKSWMPELTRVVWLAWIVVGFAFTYGNYLNSLA
jgi:hypothetical protein